jgi:hypothetical protein
VANGIFIIKKKKKETKECLMTLILETKNKSFLKQVEILAKQNGVSAVYKNTDAPKSVSIKVKNLCGIFADIEAPDKKEMRKIFYENNIG